MKVRALAFALVALCIACSDQPRPAQIESYGLLADGSRLGKELHLFTWSDYLDPGLLKEFERTYRVKVRIDYYDTNEAMLAKLKSGGTGQYDVVIASDYAVEVLAPAGLLQALDTTLLPNVRNLDPRFRNLPFDSANRFSIAYQWGTSGLGVRADLATPARELDTWKLVFDSAYAVGPFSMLSDPRETIGAALIYLGFSPNSTDSSQLAKAEQLLAAQRPRVLTYAPFATARDLLASGDVVVAHNYSGDVMLARDDAPGIRFVIPREGSLIWTDNMVVPAGAPNAYAAHVFINFILDAKVGARLSNFTRYASPNAAASQYIDPQLLSDPAIYPDSALMGRLHYLRDVGSARVLYDRLWTRLRAGK